jgi:phosphoglycerate dehydrogenase-like enzyme
MRNVLIASGPIRHQAGRFREILTEAGFEPVDPDGDWTLSPDELRAHLPSVVATIAGGERLDGALLERAKDLRVIARTGVGYDAVDLDAATRFGIAVTITPGVNQDAVAEQAFALLFATVRRVVQNDQDIRAGGWDRTLVPPMRGMRLGLIGYGRIGRAMVPRAGAFQMNVVAYDPAVPASELESQGVRPLALDELLATSDVVSLHLPLNPETLHFMNARRFAQMKPGSYLLNTARGGVVDEPALADALMSGHLAGAGLDVLSSEPPPKDHPLLKIPSAVMSPHIAGIDRKSMFDMAEMAARTVVEMARGEWPDECVVNRAVRDRWKW